MIPRPVRGLAGDERARFRREAARLYEDGKTVRAIAAELSMSYGLTHLLLREAETPMRRVGGRLGTVPKMVTCPRCDRVGQIQRDGEMRMHLATGTTWICR